MSKLWCSAALLVALNWSYAHGSGAGNAPRAPHSSVRRPGSTPPSLEDDGEGPESSSTAFIRVQTTHTQNVLRPYTSDNTMPPEIIRTPQKLFHPPFQTTRFCYQLIRMKERGEIDVVVRLPRDPTLSSTHDCYNIDYPTHSAHLGSAEIVLDLNGQPNAVNVSNIVDFSVSPRDDSIAFACSTNTTADLELSVQSLVKRDPPTRLSKHFNNVMLWSDEGDHFYYTETNVLFNTKLVMEHEVGNSFYADQVMFEISNKFGNFILSSSKTYFFFADAMLKKSQMVVGRRKDGETHFIYKVPRYTQFWMDELDEGVVLGTEDLSTGNRSFTSYISNEVLDRSLQGNILRDEDVQPFGRSISLQDIAVTANGRCLLRLQIDSCSGRHLLNAHRLTSYGDGNCKQSTCLSESFPVAMQLPAEDLELSSIATTNGTRAILYHRGIMRAHIYSFDCSANALLLERIIGHQGFDAEPYHESVETTLTPDGSPVSWRLVYRKDMVKSDGANPLVFLPDAKVGSLVEPRNLQEMAKLMDKGFIFALANLKREHESVYKSALSRRLDAINRTTVQLEAVIDRAIHLNLTHKGRVAVVARGSVAVSLAILVNKKPDLLQAAVLQGAPLSVSTLGDIKTVAIENPATQEQALALDPIKNLPPNGISTNILVSETSQSSVSANSADGYISGLHENSRNTGLALLDVPSNERPRNESYLFLQNPIKPFLLATLCPEWFMNNTCM